MLIIVFNQLEQEILDFSQGLRAIGVAPDEKIALFADNSCRWLVADQGNHLFVSQISAC
jgi:long-chain acyl-CoA synthetase